MRLKSRKSEAVPITREERHERQERARKLMSENALDAIVLMGGAETPGNENDEGTSLRYFTGIRWWGGERLFAVVLPAKGAAFCVCPAFEEGRAHEQISGAPNDQRADVRTWQEDESPYQRVAQGLKETWHSQWQAGHRRNCALRLLRRNCQGSATNHARQRDSGHGRLPHDQERE